MGRVYKVSGNCTVGTNKTAVSLIGGTASRVRIIEIEISSPSSPTDGNAEFVVQRFSAAGTTTGATPAPLNDQDPAAATTAGIAASAEPTYTSAKVIWGNTAVYQRGTYRWVAPPGAELWLPVSSSAGLGIKSTQSNGSYAADVAVTIEEL